MKNYIKSIINLFNQKEIETDNHIESITSRLSDSEERYRKECSKHAVTLKKLNELTVVSSVREKTLLCIFPE